LFFSSPLLFFSCWRRVQSVLGRKNSLPPKIFQFARSVLLWLLSCAFSNSIAGLVIRWSWPTTLVSTSAITAAFWRCDWFKKFWLRRLLRYWEYDWFHWRVNDPTGKTQRDKVLGMVDGLVYILYRRWSQKRKGVSSVEDNGSSLTLT
jgi:hypothetical protein